MKNFLGVFVIAIIGLMAFSSCDPIENRNEMKGAVTEADVKAKVVVESVVRDGKKSNYIHLNSDGLAPCVTQFKYGLGTYVGTNGTVQGFVVPGNFNVYVNVLNADGTMLPPVAFPVTVEECFDVAPEWALFCGTGEKVWTWDDQASSVWGNGGYKGNTSPGWWTVKLADMDAQTPGEGAGATMTFSADGASLVKQKTDGSKINGTFSFDMSKTKKDDGGNIWAIGQLNTQSVTVLSGKQPNSSPKDQPVNAYDILKLNDSQMVLAFGEPGQGSWGTAWFWMFRAQ